MDSCRDNPTSRVHNERLQDGTSSAVPYIPLAGLQYIAFWAVLLVLQLPWQLWDSLIFQLLSFKQIKSDMYIFLMLEVYAIHFLRSTLPTHLDSLLTVCKHTTLDLTALLCICSVHEVEQLAELDNLQRSLPNLSYSMTPCLCLVIIF